MFMSDKIVKISQEINHKFYSYTITQMHTLICTYIANGFLLRLRDTLYYRKSKLNLNYAKEMFLR